MAVSSHLFYMSYIWEDSLKINQAHGIWVEHRTEASHVLFPPVLPLKPIHNKCIREWSI